jgi:hypothetical protein
VAFTHVQRAARYASDPHAVEDEAATGKKTCRESWGAVEAQAVRLFEQVAVDQQPRLTAARRDAIHALKALLARALDAVDRHASVLGSEK